MAPRKAVPNCQQFCLHALQDLSAKYIRTAPDQYHNGGVLELKLEASVRQVQHYLFHSTPTSLCSRVAIVFLKALKSWLDSTRSTINNDQQTEINDGMYIGLRLAEVVANDRIEALDLSCVPKQIRSCLYGCLSRFQRLKYLDMGSGHGGWLSESFCNRFYGIGFDNLHHLVVLRFHHDCTDHIIHLISTTNAKTLKVLDLSYSQYVSDACSIWLARFEVLQELDTLGTSLSVEAVAFVLSRLATSLKKVNAVKLAQALELVAGENQIVNLVECMPETDRCGFVTATTSRHLKTLSSKCPRLASLNYFSETNYAPLDLNNNGDGGQEDHLDDDTIHFKHLQVLNAWGGALRRNLLTKFGAQLVELKLVHVENVTLSGTIRTILTDCTNLKKLELQNCSLKDEPAVSIKMIQKSQLKHLTITSKCSEIFIDKLIGSLLSLEILECGISTALSDVVVAQNLGNLKHLRIFRVAHSKKLTGHCVKKLLDSCSCITEISDLAAFSNVSKDELATIQSFLRDSNLDVCVV
jgi:hypothetical protein